MALFSVSLFGGDLLNISGSIDVALNAGVNVLHIDIMDGHATPDFGFNINAAKTIAALYAVDVDAHLMVKKPEEFIGRFAGSKLNHITLQAEECDDIYESLMAIKSIGIKAGLAIAPNTRVSEVKEYIPYCDEIIVMTVVPGEGGGRIHENAIGKISELKITSKALDTEFLIAVDGSMNIERAGRCIGEGADKIIAGTAFFSAKDRTEFAEIIKKLRIEQKNDTGV